MKKVFLFLLPVYCMAHPAEHHEMSHQEMHHNQDMHRDQDMRRNDNFRRDNEFRRNAPEVNSYNPVYVNPNPYYQNNNGPTIQDLEELKGTRE